MASQPQNNIGSDPVFAASDGARSFFWSAGNGPLDDLWVSDGTQAGTRLVASGLVDGAPDWQPIVAGGLVLPSGRAVMIAPGAAEDLSVPPRVVGSDGTAAGTAFVDQELTAEVGILSAPVELAGEAWFVGTSPPAAEDPTSLWRTDGTPGGTAEVYRTAAPSVLVGDPVSGGGGLFTVERDDPTSVTAAQSILRFDSAGGAPTEFYRAAPGEIVTPYAWLPATGRLLVMIVATEAGFGGPSQDWWAIDASGAQVLAAAEPFGNWATLSGGNVFFTGRDGNNEPSLFLSDGTGAGTAIVPGATPSSATAGAPLADGVVYLSASATSGLEPAFANAAGSTQLIETAPGAAGAVPAAFVEWSGGIYFSSGGSQIQNAKLFRTDGTPAGTFAIATPGTLGAAPLFAAGRTAGGLLHSFNFPGIGAEVWSATLGSTALLFDIIPNGTESAEPVALARVGQELLFFASGVTLNDLYGLGFDDDEAQVIEGSGAFIKSLDLDEGALLGDRLIASGAAPGEPLGLLVSDGTAAGTELIQLDFGGPMVDAGGFVAVDDGVYFVADFGFGHRLLRTDGTAAGTAIVSNVTVRDPDLESPVDAEGLGGADVFFSGLDAAGYELWRSDGTSAGTFQVADINQGAASSLPQQGRVIGDRFVFVAADLLHGLEVWATDGTAAGTYLAADLKPGPDSGASVPTFGRVTATLGDRFVVWSRELASEGPVAVDPLSGQFSFLVNPVVSATTPGLAKDPAGEFVEVGDDVMFASVDFANLADVPRLWRTGGSGGFAQLLNVAVEKEFSATAVGGGVALFEGVGATGAEPWVSLPGGSVAQVADLWPGPSGSSPGPAVQIGNRVFFAATDSTFGRELFEVSVAGLGAHVAEPIGAGCAQAGSAATLAPVGEPTLGSAFGVQLAQAAALAPVVWAVDTTVVPLSIDGPCQPLLTQPVPLALGTTDAGGSALLDLDVPSDPALLDLAVYFQVLVVEVPGPYLGIASLSDGLEVVVGP